MMEYSRFVMASIVLQTHIWPLGAPWLGWQSVFGFYTLSGFLMTRVLHVRYGFGPRSFVAFAANRFLRLWPAYLIVVLLTVAATALLDIRFIFQNGRLPSTLSEWAVNLTILGLVGFDFERALSIPRFVITGWSLSIELFCYILLAVFFAKNTIRLAVLGFIGIVANVASLVLCRDAIEYGPYCVQNRYGVLQAGFIPFAIGGLLYFHAKRLHKLSWSLILAVGLVFLCLELLVAFFPVLQFTMAPFLGCVAIGLIILASMSHPVNLPASDFFGRASYHLFIAQWTIAAVLISGLNFTMRSLTLCIATLLVSVFLSGLLVPIEHSIEKVRGTIRQKARSHQNVSDFGRPGAKICS